MRTALLLPIAAGLTLTLAGCGKKAHNETAEAAESIPGDSNAMGEAVSDVNAAEAAIDNGADLTDANMGNAAEDGDAGDAGSGDDSNQIFD